MSVCIRYSEAFKMQVVRELESGRHGNCNAAAEAYGIRGTSTVQNWIRHYGNAYSLGKVVRVETTEERDQLKLLKSRIRDLESALSDAHIDLAAIFGLRKPSRWEDAGSQWKCRCLAR